MASLLVAATVVGACGSPALTDAGWVTDVKAISLTNVESFTLRDRDGNLVTYRVGPLELDGGAFPASHLNQHMALAQPVAVAYHLENGDRIATRLVDAPWLQP